MTHRVPLLTLLRDGVPTAEPPAKRARAAGGGAAGTAAAGAAAGAEAAARGDCYYGDYLRVERLLSCQAPRSSGAGTSGVPAHDELLFIITHQAYELWFKQILHELTWVHQSLGAEVVSEAEHLRVVQRLRRVVKILKLLVAQFEVLETMTPLDFMEFRGDLEGASGFQSVQFRKLEALLGVPHTAERSAAFDRRLTEADLAQVGAARETPSLVERVGAWLERTPGLDGGFDFFSKFEAATTAALKQQRDGVLAGVNTRPAKATSSLLAECAESEAAFRSIFDEGAHALLQKAGRRHLSRRAMLGAILIRSYRDQPRFHTADQILEALMDIDSLMVKWRNEHVLMVHRMIGNKVGTGGSSGHAYLRSTLDDGMRGFSDLFDLTGFLMPAHQLPAVTPAFAELLHTVPVSTTPERETS